MGILAGDTKKHVEPWFGESHPLTYICNFSFRSSRPMICLNFGNPGPWEIVFVCWHPTAGARQTCKAFECPMRQHTNHGAVLVLSNFDQAVKGFHLQGGPKRDVKFVRIEMQLFKHYHANLRDFAVGIKSLLYDPMYDRGVSIPWY